MKVLFAGTPDVAVPALDAVIDAGHEVLGVLTRPPAPAGRGRKLVPSPVALRAAELGLQILTPDHPADTEFQQALAKLAPDVCPVVAYGALLPSSVLSVPEHGWVNLHFSVLPRWRGAAPVQRAIISGDAEVGATTFRIVRELDAGPVYLTMAESLPRSATAGDVLSGLAVSGARLLVDTLQLIADGAVPVPQPETGITLAPKLTRDGAVIDWRRDAPSLHDHIRGHAPEPGAWTLCRDARLKILLTAPSELVGLAPGKLRITKRQVFVGTGAGALELLSVQPVGKRPMAAADWARGGIADGEILGMSR